MINFVPHTFFTWTHPLIIIKYALQLLFSYECSLSDMMMNLSWCLFISFMFTIDLLLMEFYCVDVGALSACYLTILLKLMDSRSIDLTSIWLCNLVRQSGWITENLSNTLLLHFQQAHCFLCKHLHVSLHLHFPVSLQQHKDKNIHFIKTVTVFWFMRCILSGLRECLWTAFTLRYCGDNVWWQCVVTMFGDNWYLSFNAETENLLFIITHYFQSWNRLLLWGWYFYPLM